MAEFAMIRYACFVFALLGSQVGLCADEEWVTVGSPGNRADISGHGAVAYEFQIMRCEVTVRQYTEFLNCVAHRSDPHQLWLPAMGEHVITDLGQGGIRKDVPQCILREGEPGAWSYRPVMGREECPVFFVSFYSALRYANWRHQGIPNGDTETGAYVMSQGENVTRSTTAKVWLPSEDEWYKAAYFQSDSGLGTNGRYWEYPVGSQTKPVSSEPGSELENAACFSRGFSGMVPVGSYPKSKSPWGALDMGGNVWEWNESCVFGTKRVMRGGSTAHSLEKLRSNVRSNASPDRWYPDTGFRLARSVEK